MKSSLLYWWHRFHGRIYFPHILRKLVKNIDKDEYNTTTHLQGEKLEVEDISHLFR